MNHLLISSNSLKTEGRIRLNSRYFQKSTFKTLFALLAIALMLLPFVNVFNHFLTRLVEGSGFYKVIEIYITPHIIKLVIVVLRFFGIETRWGQSMFLVYKEGQPLSMIVSWNCIGWQSLVIFFVSLITGLSGNFTRLSKIECVLIGVLGTFLLNLGRIVASVLAIIYVNRFFSFVLHDYLMVLVTILWLFGFWYFSYAFVLMPKAADKR